MNDNFGVMTQKMDSLAQQNYNMRCLFSFSAQRLQGFYPDSFIERREKKIKVVRFKKCILQHLMISMTMITFGNDVFFYLRGVGCLKLSLFLPRLRYHSIL